MNCVSFGPSRTSRSREPSTLSSARRQHHPLPPSAALIYCSSRNGSNFLHDLRGHRPRLRQRCAGLQCLWRPAGGKSAGVGCIRRSVAHQPPLPPAPQLCRLLLLLQVFQEETEFRAGIDDTRGRRRAANSSTNQQTQATLLAREEQQAAQQLQTAALAYVRCLQQLLQVCVQSRGATPPAQ